MKKVISMFCALVVLAAGLSAQNNNEGRRNRGNGWRERLRAEKVAFLTNEIDLTESEAQVFWPIYNQLQKEQREVFEATMQAFRAMKKGVDEGKTGKEMEKLVRDYMEAQEKSEGLETRYLTKLLKALPAEKVARYYVAEEDFRYRQIGRLGQGPKLTEEQREHLEKYGEKMEKVGEKMKEQIDRIRDGRKKQDTPEEGSQNL